MTSWDVSATNKNEAVQVIGISPDIAECDIIKIHYSMIESSIMTFIQMSCSYDIKLFRIRFQSNYRFQS